MTWKAGRKLGSKLISYAYPKPLPNDTTGSTADMIDANTENAGTPDTGTPCTGTPDTDTATADFESSNNAIGRIFGSLSRDTSAADQPPHQSL
eukprot:SAG11_NODE_2625_length_3164_cov_3.186623_1_plen_93_part_00